MEAIEDQAEEAAKVVSQAMIADVSINDFWRK